MASNNFDIMSILRSINPNISPEVVKAAKYFTKGNRDLYKSLMKPTKAEKATSARLSRVKSEEALAKQVGDLFAGTREQGAEAIRSASALGEGIRQAVAGAAGGVEGAVGGDSRVAGLLASAAQQAQGVGNVAEANLRNIGESAIRSTSEQQGLAMAQANTRRSELLQELEDLLTSQQSERISSRTALGSDMRSNLLSMISALAGMKPSGGYGGSSTGTASTGGGMGNIVNLFGQVKQGKYDVTGPSGYYTYNTPGDVNTNNPALIPPLRRGVTGSASSTVPPTNTNVYRPGYGPSGSQGPRR